MPSPTDFNLSPYYDDFAENKKFHRILFRPAFAVQARELTQSQTILQNQIERVSDHLFEKGAMVIPGEIGYDLNYYSVKLTSFTDSQNVGVTLTDFIGLELTGATSGVKAKVINQTATDGTDPNTLYVKYVDSGTNSTSDKFTAGETISVSTTLQGQVTTVSAVVDSCFTGSAAYVGAGVYYINGFHVNVIEQTLILDKYSNTPSYRIGLQVAESFVTPNEDPSLNDNAQGVSNTNAPGSHRFKIDLTLKKLTLASAEDNNFVELLRLKSGIIQNQVRTTEYAVLEDTLARRTYDESGDYAVRDFELEVREHLKNGNNRGIFTSANGGLETKLALGLSPGKAYVKGYEIETLTTTYVDADKARDFDTENNFSTKFDLGNFVYVNNVFGSPDIGFVSGSTEAFKGVNLYKLATASGSRGTERNGLLSSLETIGRAKSRGFEYVTGSPTSFTFSSNGITNTIFKNYLFDIEMFTHLNITTAQAFTTGEKITGGSTNATGFVQSVSNVESVTITSVSAASPGVVTTASNHNFKEGQQVTISSIAGWAIDSTASDSSARVYTVRNPSANTFELYNTNGTTAVNVTTGGTGGTAEHGLVVLTNVQGAFSANETITGGTSSNTAVIQGDAAGFKGARHFEFSAVKQIGQPGTPTYTADTALSATYGENATLTGNLSIASSGSAVIGSGTRFTTELKVGDSITFDNTTGASLTRTIEAILSDTSLTLSEAITATAVSSSIAVRRRAKLQDANKNVAIFQMGYDAIKTLKTTSNSGLSDTNFKVRRQFSISLSSGTGQISAGNNETFTSLSEGDYIVSIINANSASAGATGNILSLTGNNGDGNPIFTLSGSPTGKTLDFDFGTAYADADLKIVATVNRSIANSKTKTLQNNSTKQANNQSEIQSGTISLGKADILNLDSIKMSANFSTDAISTDTDVTDRFELDNGQRDNFYDVGRIKLKPGALAPTGRLLITFDFFTHGSGDYFDVDSYSGVVDYENIPSYVSDTSGKEYQLRDSLDFRPRVDDASTINSGNQDRSYTGASLDVVKFGEDVTADFEYYLSRIDKVFLDKDGSFKIVKGASSLEPQVPKGLDSGMHLYTLLLSPYTLTPESVEIERQDNRRYTMRDIGKLEQRIENVEYYTQLSLLEQNAQSLQIQDADGFDRFKNGFIVDNFTGHGIGDVGNLDYKCSMDMANGQVRPTFKEDAVKLIETDDKGFADGSLITEQDRVSSNYAKTGDIITLPYTETTLVDQPFASKFINVNPFNVFTWIGSIDLDPPGDEWKETERAPDLLVNQNGAFDTMVQNLGNPNLAQVEMGTVWNEWQDMWAGQPVEGARRNIGGQIREQAFVRGAPRRVLQRQEITTIQQVNQTRTGIRSVLVPQVVRNSLGDRVINVAFIPFIRSRTVNFTGKRFKPNTRLYGFFDDQDVNQYITPTGGALGGNIISNAQGEVSGTFAIPDPTVDSNPRWRTGTRVFRLTASSTDDRNSQIATAGEVDYTARGTLDTVQETIVSTREPRLVRTNVSETRNIARTSTRTTTTQVGWWDPLAQTFLVDDPGGVFITSLDLYFQSKDADIPITLQIREVVNGYPSTTILPFGEVTLNPSSVNTSADSSVATTFTFPSPIYIQENVEYSFVVLANSQDYNAWVARIGENQINSNRTISQQPYAGVMFKSQNGSTWTAEQNEDIKFKIKRAEFDIANTGKLTLGNDTLPTRTLKNNSLRTTNGSKTIRVSHPNHGMHGTTNRVIISGVPSGTYNGLASDDINGTYNSISNITLDSYEIESPSSTNATSTGDIGGTAITATQNRAYDLLNLSIQTMTLPETGISYKLRPTTGKSVHGSETEFIRTTSANEFSVIANDNIYFTSPNYVLSQTNELGKISGNKSLITQLSLTSSNTKLSPVVDLARTSAVTVQNRLNSPTSSNHPDFVADTEPSGSSSAAIYCTRPISLENLSTSLDVRLTSVVRGTSEVEVYFRVSGGEETRKLDDLNWIPFNVSGEEDTPVAKSENSGDFKEYKYSQSGILEFNSFQIKIVMKGTNSSYPPKISDMRAIALAV
nr:VrlC protein [uncultured Mediterranean phage uvMED]